MRKAVLATTLIALALGALGVIVFGEEEPRLPEAPPPPPLRHDLDGPRRDLDGPRNEVAEIMDAVARMIPELGDLLKDLRATEPEEFRETIRRASDLLRELDELRRENRKFYDIRIRDERLEAACELLGRRYHKATSEEDRKKIKAHLEKALTELYDLRLKQMKAERDELKAELARIEKLIAAREKNRKELIARRLERMTNVEELYEW